MKWSEIWMNIFGTTQWLGLNMGFWVSMAVVLLIVILMNLVFWNMKPQEKTNPQDKMKSQIKPQGGNQSAERLKTK